MKYYATKISENMHKTPEGFLLCLNVPIGRVGDMDYGRGETPIEPVNGITVISRSEDELFRTETVASFEGKPLTINHPEEFVNPDNWKELAKGFMQNVRRGAGENKDDLVADILITDSFAIGLVNNGLRGLSCGYEAEYEQTGEGKGIQKNIVGNHLALVDEGRAGDAYAINDSKGAHTMKKTLAEKMKSIFAKVVDEAAKEEAAEENKSEDAAGYDELVKICKDLGEKIDAMKPKDEAPPKKEEAAAAKKKEGEDAEEGAGLEERLKALEAAVAKLLEAKSEEAGDEDEDDEEVGDDGEEGEEMGDEDPAVVGTGDVAARVEILAPGLKATKDVKLKALKKAYDTEDGKKVIDSLTGGKPTFDTAEKIDMLFITASELLKSKRSGDLSKTKKTTDFSSAIFSQEGHMTAEKMNELNAKHYNAKK